MTKGSVNARVCVSQQYTYGWMMVQCTHTSSAGSEGRTNCPIAKMATWMLERCEWNSERSEQLLLNS